MSSSKVLIIITLATFNETFARNVGNLPIQGQSVDITLGIAETATLEKSIASVKLGEFVGIKGHLSGTEARLHIMKFML